MTTLAFRARGRAAAIGACSRVQSRSTSNCGCSAASRTCMLRAGPYSAGESEVVPDTRSVTGPDMAGRPKLASVARTSGAPTADGTSVVGSPIAPVASR